MPASQPCQGSPWQRHRHGVQTHPVGCSLRGTLNLRHSDTHGTVGTDTSQRPLLSELPTFSATWTEELL